MTVLVGITHLLVEAKQDNGDEKVLVPVGQRILERHDQRL
jgi:hypothetical protein